ncbi:Uncharacterised protein [Serratia fonticola]|uniref:Uncharacterized protein n=1 Tax=Serratia fonticola TaxID=47917 RepID=A0A4U9WGC2_SERFO|nr:Uncharacterised protein [Serratia fonticola]
MSGGNLLRFGLRLDFLVGTAEGEDRNQRDTQGQAAEDQVSIGEPHTVIQATCKGREEDGGPLFGKLETNQIDRGGKAGIKVGGDVLEGTDQQERHLQRVQHFQHDDFQCRCGKGGANDAYGHDGTGQQQRIFRPRCG